MLPSITYRVQVNNLGVTDLAGNGVFGTSSSFTTGTGPDTAAPNITLVSPQNGAAAVPVNAHISVQFSEPMSSVSMESNPVVVTQAGGAVVAGTLAISADHTTMTLVPATPLAANSSYTVSVSGVADVSGNVAPAFSSTFTTGVAAATTRPGVLLVDPLINATGVAVNAQIHLQFTAAMDSTSINSGTVPVRINNSILVNGSYSVNGAVVSFAPSQPLPASTSITVTVNNSQAVDLAGNPTNSFQSSFTTGVAGDTTAPALVSLTPANGALNVPLTGQIVAQFSEPVNVSSTTSSVLLSPPSGGSVAGTIAMSSDHTVITFTPGAFLSANTTYTLNLSNIQDTAGNSIAPFTTVFTTASFTLNTGLSDSGQMVALGAPDPHYTWETGSGSVTAVFASNPANSTWLANSSTSVWLDNAGNQTLGSNDTYTTSFDLTGFNPASGAMSIAVAVDNNLTDVRLNGVSLGFTLSGNLNSNFQQLHAFPLVTSHFVSGRNQFEFIVANTGGPGGFRAEVSVSAEPQSNAFSFRRAIVIDHTKVPNTDQNNFPVLISGSYSYLASVANGGKVQNPSGFDIIFTTDPAGTGKLSHEIESYDPVTGTINFWVRVPVLSHTNDTVIYMQYGNVAVTASQEDITGVWDGNFKAVWHLKGSPLSGADSTANAFNGNVLGPSATPGEIDGAGNFSGASQYIDIGNLGARPTAGTISMWVKAPVLANFPDAFTTGPLGGAACGNAAIRFELHADGYFGANTGADNATCAVNFAGPAFTNSFTPNIWHFAVVTWDSSANAESVYYDGSNSQTITNSLFPSGFGAVKIGVGWDTSRYWNGQIDEVRMSNTARSADWIAAEYRNQTSPATFYSIGNEN